LLATVDELKRLDEELDLANAARAVLDVEAVATAHELALDAVIEVAYVVDDRRRRVARKHERRQRPHDLRPEHAIAGGGARFEPRLPLPRPSERFVVALDLRERVRDRTFGAL